MKFLKSLKKGLNTSQKGFTLIEATVSMTIFTLVIGMGLNFYMRSQSMLKLSESESHMQVYSRQSVTQIAKELRQASDYHEVPFDNVPQAKEVLFVRPQDDRNSGAVSQYLLVRYWFHQNKQGVYSLLRAQKDHGNEAKFLSADQNFQPDADNPSDVSQYQISSIIKEATVLEPGKQSYFQQDKSNPALINLRLVTATYGNREHADAQGHTQEVKRQFQIDTSINARNLSL